MAKLYIRRYEATIADETQEKALIADAWRSFANSEPAPTHQDCFQAGWIEGKSYARDAAEISSEFEKLIARTAAHWLQLQQTHPIQWDGAIDAAMEAACKEILRLRSLLLEARQWVEVLRGVYLYRDNTNMADKASAYLKKLEVLFPVDPNMPRS